MGLRNKDLISIHDLSVGEVATILDVAKKLKRKQKNGEPHQYLKGKTLGMIFSKASTRTRVSFEVGFWQLGGHPIYLNDSASQIGRGEPVRDTARVLSRFVDGIMIRTFSHESVLELAKYASIPVINGLTDMLHPCQALTDLFTIMEYKPNNALNSQPVVFVGKGLVFDNINSKDGVDYTKLLEYTSKLNEISTTENKTTDSIYVDIIKSNSSWYNYGLSNDNNWLMRYEDIVKVSSNNENANYEYLTNNTTFRSFISSGGSIKNFSSQNSFVGGFVYPSLLSLDTILTSGEDKASKYIEVGESLSIPIEFEYYTNSNSNSIVKSLYFDLRNSLIRDPYHYMIEFTGNYDMSSENIDTSSNSYNAFTDEVISMK